MTGTRARRLNRGESRTMAHSEPMIVVSTKRRLPLSLSLCRCGCFRCCRRRRRHIGTRISTARAPLNFSLLFFDCVPPPDALLPAALDAGLFRRLISVSRYRSFWTTCAHQDHHHHYQHQRS